MSADKALARRPSDSGSEGERSKRARFDRCFSGLEFKMEAKPLIELDSDKLKNEIKRWAKAVVRYARQFSGNFGSSRKAESRRYDDT
ncbi:hypothetical protein J5N97_004843 [Dioscorea zingiberensis]|uniref:Uncharacterized protein n=1 Tax=Dioscorea zingiberensis TaxID=325984 RepID=A0A9D5D977_9LILI|nr:hypothetical protein J5N97_004843 [Dioscorea zingiberensis]